MSTSAVCALLVAAPLVLPTAAVAETAGAPLELEAKIPLGAVSGRIDHLAVDLKRQQFFVAELGNDSLGVVNLAAHRTRSTLPGLKEPQGIGYEPSTDVVYVANAGDGSVRLLWAEDLTSKGRIELGADADNVRIDNARNRVLVGYGKGALAVIDPKSGAKVADIPLKAHPESFQIDESTGRAFVNVPDAGRSRSSISRRAKRSGHFRPKAIERISRWLSIAKRSGCWWCFAARRGCWCYQARMAPSLPMSIPAAMRTMFLSIPSVTGSTSAVAPVSPTFSKNGREAISVSLGFRRYRAREHRSSSPISTGHLSRFARAPASPQGFGYFGHPHDDAVGHRSACRHGGNHRLVP